MDKMEGIKKTILGKVKQEAEQIIKSAEEEALKEIENAQKQLEKKSQEEKARVLEDAEREAARIVAGASVEAHLELSKMKSNIVDRIITQVRNELTKTSGDNTSLLHLIRESISTLQVPEVRLYASQRDIGTVQKILKTEKELADKVAEVKELDIDGGVVAESVDGKLRIDNSYGTRLEMLLPQILPMLNKELFTDK